jgi:hypothetical protein
MDRDINNNPRFLDSLTVGGMCSCRLFSAGMVFCQIHGQGRICPGTINALNGSGKKPWKHARWTAGLVMLGEGRNLSRYINFLKVKI